MQKLPCQNMLNDIPGKIYFVTSKKISLEMVPVPMEGVNLRSIKERLLLISGQYENTIIWIN